METGKFSVVVHLCWKDGDRVGKKRDSIVGITFIKWGEVAPRIGRRYV